MPSKTFFHLPAEKRERLLLAAEEEFARVPYAEASINRMIRAAGIPRGSFYMYFRDKEELFHYLLKRYQDGLLQRLERVLEEQGGDLLGALPPCSMICGPSGSTGPGWPGCSAGTRTCAWACG